MMDTTSPRMFSAPKSGSGAEEREMMLPPESMERKVERLEWENKTLKEDLRGLQAELGDEHAQQMRYLWSDAYCATIASPVLMGSPYAQADAAVAAYRKRWMGSDGD